MLFEQRDQLVIYVCVANHVHEADDARSDQALRIVEVEDVSNRAQVLLERLVGRRGEQRRRQLHLASVSVVNPDLDEVRMMGSEVADRCPRLRLGRHRIRNVVPRRIERSRSWPSQSPADRTKQRRLRVHFFAQLVWQLAHVGAGADDGGKSVIGVPTQVVENVLPVEVLLRHRAVALLEEAEMAVDIDHRRHDGLPRQIDARGAGRNLQLAAPSHAGECVVLDDEG
ncbi:MAG: hypothetical protein AUH43_19200 [Acidobacteria bacterium 13_1_40CM_65_14]|nr:MAG: hypothetical protein AUH43_19200 [Acidobacteria bacterium 13_1_40CM_65_14]